MKYDKEKDNISEKKNFVEGITLTHKNSSGTLDERDAELRILQTQNKTEIDFEKEQCKEELPQLPLKLSIEQKQIELSRLSLTWCQFFIKNLLNRYLLLTSFARFSICYSRYKRIGNFVSQQFLYLFFLSIFFTTIPICKL